MAAVSMNEIARRAGIHGTSIQRRWGTRENLILDALLDYSREQLPIPDTGTLRDDLSAFARSIAAYLATPLGEALARALATADDDQILAASRAEFWRTRYDAARVIIDRAVDRHELPAGTDTALALEFLVAPLHFRKLLSRQPIDDELIRRQVDILVRGLAPGVDHG